MHASSSFVPNPSGVNEVLMVLPEKFYFYFIPKTLLKLPGPMGWPKTMMVIGDQAFTLLGDYRTDFQHALEKGGPAACIHLYQHLQEHAASPWTSRSDPWLLLAKIMEVPADPAGFPEVIVAARGDQAALAA